MGDGTEAEGGDAIATGAKAIDAQGRVRGDDVTAILPRGGASIHHVEAIHGEHRLHSPTGLISDHDLVAAAVFSDGHAVAVDAIRAPNSTAAKTPGNGAAGHRLQTSDILHPVGAQESFDPCA